MSMIDWLVARTGRERGLLGVLFAILVPLGLILGVLLPLGERRAGAERALEEARMLNIWVAARAEEAAALGLVPVESAKEIAPIGISALEQGLKQAGLWPYVSRLEARSEGGIALDFQEVEFVDLITWLQTVAPRWGYGFEGFRFEPREVPAMVKVSIALSEVGVD
ncbi:type II secretion system protein GspM [Alisedimentitalea sp. MJ-SS2]|uniref:type II secretion system protein GspM n=1 Tax=Aliisedimentitalea sp. MJ-SS2 TaxID=3049795 RepID=UPI002906B510|nr:type II secretion system protein GspM [Alisedimentitalea sp. MJ-SS2]MDU8925817.1 type II secretion system protein GspM [Alisedimentitalea sp. MJ-SS2]